MFLLDFEEGHLCPFFYIYSLSNMLIKGTLPNKNTFMALSYLNPLRWNRRVLMMGIVAFGILWFSFVDTHSIATRVKLANEVNSLEANIVELDAQAVLLEKKLDAFNQNPNLLEKIARETYFMRKPGETVYRIIEKK